MYKIQNIFLYLFARFFTFFGGGRGDCIPDRILVIQLAKLGDMVCTTPVFRAIKVRYPDVHLTVVGNRINKEVLAGNSNVDEYVVFENDSIFSFILKLRRERYTIGITLSPSFIAVVAMLVARIPCVLAPNIQGGFSPFMTKSYQSILNFVYAQKYEFTGYAPQEYLNMLSSIDVQSTDTTKRLVFSDEAGNKSNELLNNFSTEGPMIGIAVGVGNEIKRWPMERFVAVIKYLKRTHKATIILLGSPNEINQTEQALSNIEDTSNIFNQVGKLSIDELKAVIDRLDLYVSVDSGPIYIAEAFGTPTVDIVGPVAEKEQPPRGDKHLVVIPEREEPAVHIMNAREYEPEEAKRQVLAVSVDMVTKACDTLLSIYKPHE